MGDLKVRQAIMHAIPWDDVASAVGFFLWNLSTKWIGAVKTSVYIYVSPVVTVVLSMFVLDEKMTVASVSGSILILVGLIISQKRKKIN